MLRLPELRHELKTWRLPLTGRASVQLANALLEGDARERQSRFESVLGQEPSFLLWTICRSESFRLVPPRGWSSVANWLARQPITLWSGMTCGPASTGQNPPQSPNPCWKRWIEAFAARRAQFTPEARELAPAEWAFLLVSPLQWLCSAGDAISIDDALAGRSCLPVWLAEAISATRVGDDYPSGSDEGASIADSSHPRTATNSDECGIDLVGLVARLVQAEALTANLQGEKLAAMRELAYGASHEINNPLANIATRAQSLLAGEPDPERRRTLAVIASQAFRAHEMISDLMLFAKPPAIQRGGVNVSKLLQRVQDELTESATAQGTTIERIAGPLELVESITLEGDFEQLAVALTAVVQNALEALGQGGRVELSIRHVSASDGEATDMRATEDIAIIVRDNGPGISPDVQSHMFDPFFSGREAGRGLGFGLSKAWRIVTDHGGKILVASQLGHGAEITLVLPAVLRNGTSPTTRP